MTPPPFCDFLWGLHWNEDLNYPGNFGFISIWVGYEADDGMNNAVVNLLHEVKDSTSSIRGAMPLYYAYFIKFKAEVQGGLDNCDDFLCREGARWVRDNRDYLLDVYDEYARLTVEAYGSDNPIIWLIEPGLSDYSEDEQYDPLTLDELALLASDMTDVVKARMQNAVIALFHTPSYPDAREYWSHFDLSKLDVILTTGMGDNGGYFNTWDNQDTPDGTYAYLHYITGKHLLVDTGFAYSLQDDTWSVAPAEVINDRIEDGVIAVHLEPEENPQEAIYDIADNIDRLNRELDPICP